jgi:hypothetical protein
MSPERQIHVQETLQHLNTNTLTGFTDRRGHAWLVPRNRRAREVSSPAVAPVSKPARVASYGDIQPT